MYILVEERSKYLSNRKKEESFNIEYEHDCTSAGDYWQFYSSGIVSGVISMKNNMFRKPSRYFSLADVALHILQGSHGKMYLLYYRRL